MPTVEKQYIISKSLISYHTLHPLPIEKSQWVGVATGQMLFPLGSVCWMLPLTTHCHIHYHLHPITLLFRFGC